MTQKTLIAVTIGAALLAGCALSAQHRREAYVESHGLIKTGMTASTREYLEQRGVSPKEIAHQEAMRKGKVTAVSDIAQAILAGKIRRGMTKEEVEASWGNPCGWCYGTTHNSWGDSWEYNVFGTSRYGIGNGTYVYFSPSGRVVGWRGP